MASAISEDRWRQMWDCLYGELKLVNKDLLKHQENKESYDVICTLRQYRENIWKRLDKLMASQVLHFRRADLEPATGILEAARSKAEKRAVELRDKADEMLSEAQRCDAEYESLSLALFALTQGN